MLGILEVLDPARVDELSRVLPSRFQRLEMMEEEEEEGELPAFQQFEMKVLAVVKPPPEEEQPRDRVTPWNSSPCSYLLEEFLPPGGIPASWKDSCPALTQPALHRGTRPPWGSCGVSRSPLPSRG